MGNILRSSGLITPDTKFPFTTIRKISTVATGMDTCNALEEESLYEFHTFTTRRKQLTRIQEAIKSRFDYASLPVSNRNFLGIFWDGATIRESEVGLYQGIVRYRILAERLFSESINLQITSGDNLYEAIYNRYKASSKLQYELREFTTSSFASEKEDNYPFCIIPEFVSEIDSWNTQGFLEQTDFSFRIYDTSAETIERIKELIMDEFHFAGFNLADRIFCKLGYSGDLLLEEESGLWMGEVSYSLIDMKEL